MHFLKTISNLNDDFPGVVLPLTDGITANGADTFEFLRIQKYNN